MAARVAPIPLAASPGPGTTAATRWLPPDTPALASRGLQAASPLPSPARRGDLATPPRVPARRSPWFESGRSLALCDRRQVSPPIPCFERQSERDRQGGIRPRPQLAGAGGRAIPTGRCRNPGLSGDRRRNRQFRRRSLGRHGARTDNGPNAASAGNPRSSNSHPPKSTFRRMDGPHFLNSRVRPSSAVDPQQSIGDD